MYNVKVIETNDKIEVWEYETPVFSNYTADDLENVNRERRDFKTLTREEKALSFKRKERYYQEKRHEMRRLVEMNYKPFYTKFVTLTFRNHISDVEQANYIFKKFIQRYKYQVDKDIQYIAIWERTKRNRIHYHLVIFNLRYISANYLSQIWGQGFVKINNIAHVEKENVGRYIAKYFSKDLDVKDMHKKAFFTSRNLAKPTVKKYATWEDVSSKFDSSKISYTKTYDRTHVVKNGKTLQNEFIKSKVNYSIIEKK